MIELDREGLERDELGRLRLRVRWLATSRAAALSGPPRTVDGLPLRVHRGQPFISQADGRYVIDAVYEGLTEDPGPESDSYELRTEEREVAIESFPDRKLLKEVYGAVEGDEGRLEFPAILPRPQSRLGQPLNLDTYRSQDAGPVNNPLYGTTSYAVPFTTAVWRLVRRKVPGGLEAQSRTVIERLPAGFDWRGPKTQWYVRPLQRRRRGNAWEIEWSAFEVAPFQDLAALFALQGKSSGTGRGAGQGLTSGRAGFQGLDSGG
jgi:hypothetical protein